MAIPGNLLSQTTESVDPNTSGWVAKLNCTLSKGSGGRNGDGCLAVKSVASGEVQARTVSSYPVAAGQLYQVFADASGATVPERIGIRWLTGAGVELSVTWSLTTATASSSWHRVGVAGVAPVGAALAQVLLSSTPAASAVVQYWENVYLGLPIRTTGNLLDFNTETIEVDASGWSVGSNCTVARAAPANQWPVDYYHGGGQILSATVTANGNASVVSPTSSASPGVEYVAFAHLGPPTSGSTVWIELRFLDESDSQLLAIRSTLAAPGTGLYRQIASGVAPEGTAQAVLAVGITSGTAAQVVRIDNAVVAALSQTTDGQTITATPSGTVVPYDAAGFEQGVAGWTKTSGVATIARSTPWGASAFASSYSMLVTSSTATSSTIRSAIFPAPEAEGLNWRLQVYAARGTGSWTSLTLRVRWYDDDDTDLGASTGTAYNFPDSGWYILASDAEAPAGATQVAVELVASASATSSTLYVDGVALWEVLPLTAIDAFSVDGYMRLTLRELPVGDLISVWRQLPDGSRTLVRGPDGLLDRRPIVSDLMLIEDHEAPLGVPVGYWIQFYDPDDGSSGASRSSGTLVLHLDDVNLAWLKDPGNPQRNMQVTVQKAPEWQRPIEQSAQVVRGRRNKVVLSGRRQGYEGDLDLWTRTDTERGSLHLLLDSGNVLLWQAVPGMGVDDLYVNVGAVTEGRTGGLAQEPWRSWSLPLIEADMPITTGVNGSRGRTWRDVITEFATCADVLAAYATTEDLLLDRRTG